MLYKLTVCIVPNIVQGVSRNAALRDAVFFAEESCRAQVCDATADK
jgi:hypothetical protein